MHIQHLQHITLHNYPHNRTVLEISCPLCGNISELEIPTDEWLEGFKAYKNGATVQNAWPKLSPAKRELLISSICKKCWDNIFKA